MSAWIFSPPMGMHIMEGFLPPAWAAAWWLVALPFLVLGWRRLAAIYRDYPDRRLLLAMAGALVFVLSALKIPTVMGSCSHPTGIAFGAILFGPSPMILIGTLVLIFQATLLAHGGLTTLGANAFSMAVVGAFVAWAVFQMARKMGVGPLVAVFFAAVISDWSTYAVTSLQLGLAFPAESGGATVSFLKFLTVFGITQIPVALLEGLLTAMVFHLIIKHQPGELANLGLEHAFPAKSCRAL